METLGAILWPVAEVLIPIAVTILTPLLVALIVKAFQKMGVDLDAVHRDAFQRSIEKGALEAVRRAGGPALATSVSFEDVNAGVEQVVAGVPDAIKRFNVPTAEIAKRIEAQATAIVQSTPNVVLDTITDIAAATASAALPGIAKPAVDIIHGRADDLLSRILERRL